VASVCAVVALTSAGAIARADPGEGSDSSIRAMRGIYQLELASPLAEGSWAVSTGIAFFTADNLAIAGEHHRRLKWQNAFAFSPWAPLDLGLSWMAVSDSSSPVLSTSTQTLGDPELSIKLVHAIRSDVALGALLQVLVPTSASGSGLAFNATTITGHALATFEASRALRLALNAGYRFDNTRKIFSTPFAAGEEKLMRFDGNIALANSVVGGLGAIGHFEASPNLAALPFVELAWALAPSGRFKDNPIAANIGVKAQLKAAGLVELGAGTSVRIAGAPSDTSKLAGLPPWEIFARLAFHPGTTAASEPSCPGLVHCDEQTPCQEHFTCVDNACLPVHEVVKHETSVKAQATFVVSGTITDATSAAPIRGAAVRFSGSDNTLLTDDNGRFLSWPIEASERLLQVSATAPGFRPGQQDVMRSPAGDTKSVAIKLVPLGKKVAGYLRGSLTDKGTGLPVAGTIAVPSADKKFRTNPDGTFTIELLAGRYELLITAPNMKAQEKQITLGPGEVVILNIDMTPQRR
jgi:hypothetical protein